MQADETVAAYLFVRGRLFSPLRDLDKSSRWRVQKVQHSAAKELTCCRK